MIRKRRLQKVQKPGLFTRVTQENKDTSINKITSKDFIFFSGAGAVFKGLDLVIEAFNSIESSSNLYIYGPFDQEESFMKNLMPIINTSSNIFYNGFIDPMSDEFDNVVSKCAFTILPTCGESGASSVITTMHRGLIPIVTEFASVDLFDFGITIENLTIEAVTDSIKKALKLSDVEIKRQRGAIIDHINNNQTQDAYRNKLKKALKIILEI